MSISVHQALAEAQNEGLPRLEAQILLLHAMGRDLHDRTWLLTHSDETLNEQLHQTFCAFTARRLMSEPVSYITGVREFFGLSLHIDSRVLDPRADTEILVEWALSCMADVASPRILDLGTGSGAIALALKNNRQDAQVTATDISAQALELGQSNAERLKLSITFLRGSWLAAVEGMKFNAIVSNPPYIAENDSHLASLEFEPLSALASGHDGLDDINFIVKQSSEHLEPEGWLLIEHGFDQAHAVQNLMMNQGFVSVQSRPDLAGILRCTGGQRPRVK